VPVNRIHRTLEIGIHQFAKSRDSTDLTVVGKFIAHNLEGEIELLILCKNKKYVKTYRYDK